MAELYHGKKADSGPFDAKSSPLIDSKEREMRQAIKQKKSPWLLNTKIKPTLKVQLNIFDYI